MLYGSGEEEISFLYFNEKGRSTVKRHPFEGVIPNLERRWRETESANGARRAGQVPQHQDLPRLRRLAPARGSAPRADRQRREDKPGEGQRLGRAIYEVEGHAAVGLSGVVPGAARSPAPSRRSRSASCARSRRGLSFLNNVGLDVPVAGPQRGHDLRAARRSASGWPARSARA